MTTDVLAELDRTLRDFLLGTYTSAVGTDSAGGAFVALQPGGFPLSDEMFRIHPNDAAYSPNKATEEISRKTDLVGQVDDGQFRSVLSSVSELVGIAAGSFPAPGATPEVAQLLESMRADASRDLDQSELASFRLGGLPYHPTFASPEAWYDATAASAWRSMSFSASETVSTEPPPVHPPARWSWLVAAPEQRLVIADHARFATFATALQAEAGPDPEVVRVARLSRIPPELRAVTLVSDLAPSPRTVLADRARPVARSPVADRGGVAVLADLRGAGDLRVVERLDVERPEIVEVPERLVAFDIGTVAQAYDAIVKDSQPQEVETSSITLSFDYTLVTLDRQWFPAGLMANTNWYVPGYRAGQLLGPHTPTAQPAMPVAFVAVRRVRLAGTWSSRDVEALPSSVSIGPLSLVGRTITSSAGSVTVDSPGMQVVAWICQPLPTLPPLGDPAVA